MTATIFTDGNFQGIGTDGLVVPAGKLYITDHITGLPATTYQDSGQTISNTNPVVLSASGKAKVFLALGVYDIELHDSLDNVLWTLNQYSTDANSGATAYVVADIAGLLTVPASYTTATVKDAKRGGTFIWAASGTVDNVITFAGSTGVWVRQYHGEIDVKWAGAVGDGAANDFTAVQAAITAAAGATVRFTEGGYLMTGGSPVISADTTVVFDPGAYISQPNKGQNAGFIIMPNTKNVSIIGADIRGPWYGTGPGAWVGDTTTVTVDGDTWATHMAENIGIDIRGRWYQREFLGYTLAQMQALTDVCSRIRIEKCRIDGFGESGVFADNCNNPWFQDNNIYNCGRDGIRMYGASRAVVRGNTVGNMAPGYGGSYPNFNVYGITATRLYGNSSFPDPNLTIGRPSENVLIEGNHVYNCYTWKSLDTHGGRNIRFVNNHVLNSYIGIGIDHGGINSTNGVVPPKKITIANNILQSLNALYMRAGITVYANNSTDLGEQIVIANNSFDGYGGGDTDGAISVSNQKDVVIHGNNIKDAARSAINLTNEVINCAITDNNMEDPKSFAYGTITLGGTNYTSQPTITVTGGGGTGLKFTATIVAGVITQLNVIHPGYGYTSAPTITITGGGGAGATASGAFSPGYGVLSQTANAMATIDNNSINNLTQAATRGVSLTSPTAGYGVKVGRGNLFIGTGVTKVYPSIANESGGAFGKIPLYGVKALGAGTVLASFGGVSLAKTGTGVYQITLPVAAASANNLMADASLYAGAGMIYWTTISTTVVEIRTFNTAGAAADIGFSAFVYNIEG